MSETNDTTTDTSATIAPTTDPANVPNEPPVAAPATPQSQNDAQADDCDSESLEISFGLPPGSLKDVKDSESAFEALRAMTDRDFADDEPAPDSATLARRVAELEHENNQYRSYVAQQQSQAQQHMQAQFDRRIDATMDAWASPQYGVKGRRNYRQHQAVNELRDKLMTNLREREALGLPVEYSIEGYLERLRTHLEADKAAPPIKQAPSKGVLGTPGANKGTGAVGGVNTPRSIHHALMQNGS